jgi:hypothetical protein
MRVQQWAAAIGLLATFAGGLRAQEQTPEPKKPGGLNKLARDFSKESKKAGRQLKENVKDVSSDAHIALKKAGNDTKAEAKRATGYTTPAPSEEHKPGGLNKLARDVSSSSKKIGARWKHSVKSGASSTHAALTDAGKATKDTLKEIKPPV